MLKDRFENQIVLRPYTNESILILGKSGYGKTFAMSRLIEEYTDQGESVIILDFSGSYSEEELKKHSFVCELKEIKYGLEKVVLPVFSNVQKEDAPGILTEFFASSCSLNQSYRQRFLLETVCKKVIEGCWGKSITPSLVISELKDLIKRDTEELELIEKLLSKIIDLDGDWIELNASRNVLCEEGKPVVWQLSALNRHKQQELVSFMLSVLWHMAKSRNTFKITKIFVDEAEVLPLNNSPIEVFLRQGRKFGVAMIVASQYIEMGKPEDFQLLKQADSQLYFRPTPEDVRRIARGINFENRFEYERILADLKQGEALLCGNYSVNESEQILSRPIVVKVRKREEIAEEKDGEHGENIETNRSLRNFTV